MIMTAQAASIKELLERGVEKVYPSREAMEKALQTGKPLTFYLGVDASAPSLHIGNAIPLAKLAQLQALGHRVIFLVGDFTGMIGDPSDKKATRKQLDRTTVRTNAKVYKKQVAAWLSFSGRNSAAFAFNSKTYDKMSVEEFIRLAANFTVQQMLIRDMFQERLKAEKPIHLHEFLYPLLQSYDTVALGADGEVGGNDQTFNMLAGRDLVKSLQGKEKFVITTKLLVDSEGKKMGKSEGNVVSLDVSPEEMYGKIMTWPDSVLSSAFELCTKLSWEEVKEIQKRLQNTSLNPRDFKMRLAREITAIYHGTKKATQAEAAFVQTFQKGEIPTDIVTITTKGGSLLELLLELKLAPSKGEARRLLEQGGIKVSGEVIKDQNYHVTPTKEGVIVQKGKREFRKLVV